MTQSLSHVFVHLIFHTKYNIPWLDEIVRPKIFGYIAQVARDMGCPFVKVGGYIDHVHILMEIGKINRLSDIIAKIKINSSKAIKRIDIKYENFRWQGGYGVFSVDYRGIQRVIDYIENQEAHHQKKDFKDEYIDLLKENNIEYDDRYLWK